ncbi:hypothetical protein ACWDSF_08795 [Nocardia beijingensis]
MIEPVRGHRAPFTSAQRSRRHHVEARLAAIGDSRTATAESVCVALDDSRPEIVASQVIR